MSSRTLIYHGLKVFSCTGVVHRHGQSVTSQPITRVSVPSDHYNLALAREFVCAVINSMRLCRAEKVALLHAAQKFHADRDLRGLIFFNGRVSTMPLPAWPSICWSPAAIVNTTMRAAIWLSALRGKKAKRGSQVLT